MGAYHRRHYYVDWDKIRDEFVAGESLSTLANRYGIGRSAIGTRCARGKWAELRPSGVGKGPGRPPMLVTKQEVMAQMFATDRPKDDIDDITARCIRIVRTGLDKIEAGMTTVNPTDTAQIRAYTSSLRDLQTVAGAFAGMTRQEIAARIESLSRKAEEEQEGTGVVVIPAVAAGGRDDPYEGADEAPEEGPDE